MTFQHETHKDLPAAFQALEAGDNRTFHQCIHRIRILPWIARETQDFASLLGMRH